MGCVYKISMNDGHLLWSEKGYINGDNIQDEHSACCNAQYYYVDAVKTLVEVDQCGSDISGLYFLFIFSIKFYLRLRKVCTLWVPHLLSWEEGPGIESLTTLTWIYSLLSPVSPNNSGKYGNYQTNILKDLFNPSHAE